MTLAESERFLDELTATACQSPRVYTHTWQIGDLVLWDNLRKSRSYWREGGHVQVKSVNIVHRCLPGGLGVSRDIGQFSHLFPQLKKTVVEISVRNRPITVSFTLISAHNCEFHTYFGS